MKNAWGVEPGQTWVHPNAVLLVVDAARGCEWFRCLVLDAQPGAFGRSTWETSSIVTLTAFVVAWGGRLA